MSPGYAFPKDVRNFLILLVADGLVSVAIGVAAGVSAPLVMADITFAEGALLLVAGGIAGIYALSPSLHRVKRYFDERYEARSGGQEGGQAPASEALGTGGTAKPAKPGRAALRIIVWGLVLLLLSSVLSVVIVLIP